MADRGTSSTQSPRWHRGWAWTTRHDGLIPAGRGLATLFAGGALGIVPVLVTEDWNGGTAWALLWLAAGLAMLAAAALAVAEVARRGRDRMIRQNGTAYLIAEEARGWQASQNEGFIKDVRQRFARVIRLPGPYDMERWDWPLDDGARQWEAKMGELVRAFQVLDRDARSSGSISRARAAGRPGPGTPNGVFIWAWWAVAMAFGMRVTGMERGPVLDSWQRPSFGRAGDVLPETWVQRPHRFGACEVAPDPLGLHMVEAGYEVELTVARRGRGRSSRGNGEVAVLLVRFSRSPWGPLPLVTEEDPAAQLALQVYDTVGAAPAGTLPGELHELRCVPPNGGFPWADFPALVSETVVWVERKARELTGRTLLLGTVIPQEVGLGIGILAGQQARRESWPAHLRPVIYDPVTRGLVVPNLELGTSAVYGSGSSVGGA
jgi:hypothetical protein